MLYITLNTPTEINNTTLTSYYPQRGALRRSGSSERTRSDPHLTHKHTRCEITIIQDQITALLWFINTLMKINPDTKHMIQGKKNSQQNSSSLSLPTVPIYHSNDGSSRSCKAARVTRTRQTHVQQDFNTETGKVCSFSCAASSLNARKMNSFSTNLSQNGVSMKQKKHFIITEPFSNNRFPMWMFFGEPSKTILWDENVFKRV